GWSSQRDESWCSPASERASSLVSSRVIFAPLASRPPRRPIRLSRPSHATCNLRAAAEKTNSHGNDHPLIWFRVWFEPGRLGGTFPSGELSVQATAAALALLTRVAIFSTRRR